jgi:hypothetical protein
MDDHHLHYITKKEGTKPICLKVQGCDNVKLEFSLFLIHLLENHLVIFIWSHILKHVFQVLL